MSKTRLLALKLFRKNEETHNMFLTKLEVVESTFEMDMGRLSKLVSVIQIKYLKTVVSFRKGE